MIFGIQLWRKYINTYCKSRHSIIQADAADAGHSVCSDASYVSTMTGEIQKDTLIEQVWFQVSY